MNNQSIHDRVARLTSRLIELDVLLTRRPGEYDEIVDFLDEHAAIQNDAQTLVDSLSERSRRLIRRIQKYQETKSKEAKDETSLSS